MEWKILVPSPLHVALMETEMKEMEEGT